MMDFSYTACAVDLFDDRHSRIAVLGVGVDAVIAVARFVDAGAKGAQKVAHSFSCNYDITFTGAALRAFLAERFPGRLKKEALDAIDDEREYTVSSFDMS